MAFVLISGGKQLAIDPTELITEANAQKVIDSLKAVFPGTDYTQQEWVEPDHNATLVYDSDAKIRQIMPGYQDAAQLYNVMNAVPGGWAGPPDAARWQWDGKSKPAPVDPPSQPNAPFGPQGGMKPSAGEQTIIDGQGTILAAIASLREALKV